MAALPPRTDGPHSPPFPCGPLLEDLERIPDPAFLVSPGGHIVAVNDVAARLADVSLPGMTVRELIGRYGAQRADGSRIDGDLPYTRALRGEVVGHGERLRMTLPNGSVFHAVVTSTPVVVDGKVVAALSVFHDFNEYVRGLARREAPMAADDPRAGGARPTPEEGTPVQPLRGG